MAGFSDIIGHEQIIGHLKNAIALDKSAMHIFLTDQSFPENDACRGFCHGTAM